MAKYLNGARLWNAVAYYDTNISTLTQGFDTVSVCLSKGLGHQWIRYWRVAKI